MGSSLKRWRLGPSSVQLVAARSALSGEPDEIVEQRHHQRAVPGVLSRQARGIKIEQMPRLDSRLRPRSGRYSHHVMLELGLPLAQFPEMGLDLGQCAAQVGRLLRRHAAMLVEINGLVSHGAALASAACALARSTEPIESISMEPRTSSAGTTIIVARRR